MKFKLISSLEKCFLDESIDEKIEYSKGSCFKNEMFHFGVAYCSTEIRSEYAYLSVESSLKEYITVRKVANVPVQFAAKPECKNNDYLRTEPGLYPDFLQPLPKDGRFVVPNTLRSLYIEVDTKGEIDAGIYPITLCFTENVPEKTKHKVTFMLEIIDELLPEIDFIFTQWFHCDCLMNYYGVECFSEEHWRIIENFMKNAAKYGMNMALTPVFTPPLDTPINGERPTVQLVDVFYKNGKYSFGFDKLARWIKLCESVGIKYFEISHLFTQWGVKCAPKIMAECDDGYKKLFGWENASDSEEYVSFLDTFLPKLIEFLKSYNNVYERTYFHVSDEPKTRDIELYKKAMQTLRRNIGNRPIFDALSDYEFYREGVCQNPIPGTNAIEPFLENNVKDLWCYTCEAQSLDVANRFIALPSYRNRIIGIQMYKYDIKGYLHYGFNYYYNRYSYEPINPYHTTDGDLYVPAGDCFTVYPSQIGEALSSIRQAVFYDALQDMRALLLYENYFGKEETIKLIDEYQNITFKNYPHNSDYILQLRHKINSAIKDFTGVKFNA